MRRMTSASVACRRLMIIPDVGQLTALAFVAAIDDPSRIRRSRDVGAYLGLVPRRYQSGEVGYASRNAETGGCGTLLYEAANVMLTRYKGQRSSRIGRSRWPRAPRCARRASLWRMSRDHHERDAAGRNRVRTGLAWRPHPAPARSDAKGGSRRRRGLCCSGRLLADCAFNLAALNPAYPIKRQPSAQRTQASQASTPRRASLPLTH
jgi:hypothetical protein